MKILNLDGPLFRLLADFGLDFTNFDSSTATVADCFIIAICMLFCLVFILLIIRGLFYALRELTGSCLR